ncbi:hypothetical protein Gotri_021608 [Gossypium trilobum]|uniref:PDZ domain-containing protein n=3 Tax=Gossypium TaxID=3633 RepID=A0A7J9DD39_9ROSI|nr:hypothetical protein [Gossypium davidsonii]MBA0640831.1 hypothetical protein [Gossypium klotzschianum]MBA0758629.1 hypothetical protein [Gossypium trilobum]
MSFPLQLISCRAAQDFHSRDSSFINGVFIKTRMTRKKKNQLKVLAMSSDNSTLKMNLNEYMVTLQKPLGIRFGLSLDGRIFVHALKRGSNAEKSRIIMVGDTLKKTSDSSGGSFTEIKNFGDAQEMLTEETGSFSLVLERPFSPFPIHELHQLSDLDILFNRGRMPVATWNKALLASNLQTTEGGGNSGFVVFSSKFLASPGLKFLNDQNGHVGSGLQKNILSSPVSQLVCIFSEKEPGDGEWAHGSFPLEEYIKALERSKGELYYNHSLGMRYSKITEQIYVGSCIQTDADVKTLSDAGITAVLNFQSGVEAENWEINSKSINESCQRLNVLMINYPIKDGDSFDLRKRLPFSVGLLLRLLKKNHRVFVTCTTGFDRSPACVIAYLHWMTDTPLHAAHNFVTGLHTCKPDRPAIAWATWDLIAMVESGRHDGPATHALTFVWNGHNEGEDVCLVGDFTGNWKEPIKATHKGGARYEVEIRLPQGKYYYKYIINGNWRHSTSSPTERDERGNINNVIMIGDTASVRPTIQPQQKDANLIKVIERPLTENERFMLAKAARCIAFSVCPIRLVPK